MCESAIKEPSCLDCQLAQFEVSEGMDTIEGQLITPNGDPRWPLIPSAFSGCVHNEDAINVLPICEHFKPWEAGYCAVCKNKIDGPEYLWDRYVFDWSGKLPVCSLACETHFNLKAKLQSADVRIADWKIRTGQIKVEFRSYCPDCGLEVSPFEEIGDGLFWVDDNGALHIRCPSCEQVISPVDVCYFIDQKISYQEALARDRAKQGRLR